MTERQYEALKNAIAMLRCMGEEEDAKALEPMLVRPAKPFVLPKGPALTPCSCASCEPLTWDNQRFIICHHCGNKRCPKASNHIFRCTNSNEPGQVGELE